MDIREQINDLRSVHVIHGPLRSWPIAKCEEFADTMEKLLAVYEAADLFLYCARTYGTQVQEGVNSGNQLAEALTAVKS